MGKRVGGWVDGWLGGWNGSYYDGQIVAHARMCVCLVGNCLIDRQSYLPIRLQYAELHVHVPQVDARATRGVTPLHYAAFNGRLAARQLSSTHPNHYTCFYPTSVDATGPLVRASSGQLRPVAVRWGIGRGGHWPCWCWGSQGCRECRSWKGGVYAKCTCPSCSVHTRQTGPARVRHASSC